MVLTMTRCQLVTLIESVAAEGTCSVGQPTRLIYCEIYACLILIANGAHTASEV